MKGKRTLVSGLICLTLIVASSSFMAACAKSSPTPQTEWPEAQVWSGVATGTTSNIMLIALGEIVTKELGIRVAVQPTTSATESLTRLVDGATDLCITTTYDLYNRYQGTGEFDGKGKGTLRALAGQYVTLIHIAAQKDIKEFEDIRGKRVMIEEPSAKAFDILARACVDAYGMTYDDFIAMPRLGPQQAVAAMKDRTTDVAFQPAHPPAPFFSELATDMEVNFLSIDEDKAKVICEELPFYTYQNIPAGTYRGQDEDVMCVGWPMVLVVRSDFPEDLAYEVVKLLFDNLEELGSVHPVFTKLDLSIATAYRGSPYHSGAVKYYQEQGVWTSELEAMQQNTLAALGQEK
jgi:TRAP transporter TAXI family solute receptor